MSRANDRDESAVGRRVAKNTVLLSIGQVVLAGSMGLWTIVVARYVGPDTFGIYASAQAAAAILLIVVSLGLDPLLTRDVAQRPEEGSRYLATFTAIRIGLTVPILLGAFFLMRTRGYPAERGAITALVALNVAVMGLNQLVTATLNAHEAMGRVVIAQSANYLLTLATGVIAAWLGRPLTLILALSVAGSLIQLALGLVYVHRIQQHPGSRPASPFFPAVVALGLLRTAIPFTLLQFISNLRTYAPPLMVQYLTHNDAQVGYFSAAQRIHAVTVIVPDMLLHAIFPALSRSYANARDRFGPMFERAYRYVFFVTVPLALVLWIIAPPLLTLLYGARYTPAIGSLQVLSLALVGGVGWVMGPAMLAMGKQSAYSLIYIATMAAAGIASLWTIPRYGQTGAAAALVAGKVLQDVIYSVLMFRWLNLRYPTAWVAKTVAATVAMSIAVWVLVPRVHFLLAASVAPVAYLACHIWLRTLSREDGEYLRRLLPQGLERRLPAWLGRRTRVPEEDVDAS